MLQLVESILTCQLDEPAAVHCIISHYSFCTELQLLNTCNAVKSTLLLPEM